jgi:hypothetical protein
MSFKKQYITQFQAINRTTGELTDFAGPYILAVDQKQAEEICLTTMPWLEVVGELIAEVDEIEVDGAIDKLLFDVNEIIKAKR